MPRAAGLIEKTDKGVTQHHVGSPRIQDSRLAFAYAIQVFDSNAAPAPELRALLSIWARLHHCRAASAEGTAVNTQVVPTRHAIEESVDLAHEISTEYSAKCQIESRRSEGLLDRRATITWYSQQRRR
jgi:hypothetical protein